MENLEKDYITFATGPKKDQLWEGYNRTYSTALWQAKFYLPWQPSAPM